MMGLAMMIVVVILYSYSYSDSYSNVKKLQIQQNNGDYSTQDLTGTRNSRQCIQNDQK